MTLGKVLAVAGVALGGYTVIDKIYTGSFWWEKITTMRARQTQAQVQSMVNFQVAQQIQQRERQRLAKEKSEVIRGKYASEPSWTNPSVNYGLSRY